MIPIWKDIDIDLGASLSQQYSIEVQGAVVYTGKAVKRPGAASIVVRINDIIADYLYQRFPKNSIGQTQVNVRVLKDETEVWADIVEYNWSYDDNLKRNNYLNLPITPEIDAKQPLIITQKGINSMDVRITDSEGNVQTVTINRGDPLPGDFNADYNADFFVRVITEYYADVLFFFPKRYSNAKKIELMDSLDTPYPLIYDVVSDCKRYALYYVNEIGGWDSVLIKGQGIESDRYQRYESRRKYDNTSTSTRDRFNYLNDITRSFELHTGWLPLDAGERIHNLLGSNNVLLYDMERKQYHSVIITDTECRYKTYKNSGGRLFEYAVNVELAQERIRR